ncbi:MAG: alpha/beta hydrolase family protein [Candidatus Sulfotelmatobacter sp.]
MLLPGKTKFISLILFSGLLACPVYADTPQSSPSQKTGSPIKHFFVRSFCYVFGCKSASKPAETTKPADTAPLAAGETGTTAKSAPAETAEVKPEIPGAKTILLKPGEKVPERVDKDYEDWSKPQLTSGMRLEAVPLARGEGAGFTKEMVYVQWREMDPIDLWVVKPKGVVKPPVVLYLYSYPATNERYKDEKFCDFLTQKGFAAVGFVSALTEQRFHDRPTRDSFINQLQESLGATVHDVQMVLNYLASRGDLDMTRVGMWGDGSGATIALMAAAVDPRIKVLDLLDPWGDWPDWLAGSALVSEKERPFFLSTRFLQSVEGLEPMKWLPELKDRRVRLQYILNGVSVTPAIARERIEKTAPPNVEIIHYDSTKEFVEKVASAGTGFDWIKQQTGTAGDIREAGNSRDESVTKTSSQTKNTDH